MILQSLIVLLIVSSHSIAYSPPVPCVTGGGDGAGCLRALGRSSVYDWFKDAEKNSADANALIKAIHYYCSLNLAPYDTFMCDLLHEVESGEGEKVEKITLPEVKECTENGCLDKFIPSGDRFEPFRTVMSAITGWKVEDDEKDVAAVIHADFEKCRAEHVNGNNCLSFLYVKEACSAICKATKCRVKAYFGSDSKPCREAVTSSCHKMYEEADKLCLSMHKSITADFPEHKCEEDCSGPSPGSDFSLN